MGLYILCSCPCGLHDLSPWEESRYSVYTVETARSFLPTLPDWRIFQATPSSCNQGSLYPGGLVTCKTPLKVIPTSNLSRLRLAESSCARRPACEASLRGVARPSRAGEPANRSACLRDCFGCLFLKYSWHAMLHWFQGCLSFHLRSLPERRPDCQRCFFEWFHTRAFSAAARTIHRDTLPGWEYYPSAITSSFSFPKQ